MLNRNSAFALVFPVESATSSSRETYRKIGCLHRPVRVARLGDDRRQRAPSSAAAEDSGLANDSLAHG